MVETKKSGFVSSITGYPSSVYFILANELCERFSFYGLRAVLTLYLINEHRLQESTAFLLYHAFISFVYFSPLIGSVLADNYWGRYRVIVLGSVIYIVGLTLLSIGAINTLSMSARSVLGFGGLAVIALATGGIKPCVSSFAADQFEESRQSERARFFSFFYFAINLGALISMFLTPVLRSQFQCFGSDYCFPLAFGVPSVFMLIATVIFVCGSRFYYNQPTSKKNVVGQVFKCIFESAYARFSNPHAEGLAGDVKKDWLSYAPVKYDSVLVASVRSFVKVLVIFLPLPFYHALSDQQGSTWVVQARAMNGNVGEWLTILPDQMNMFNCVFVLLAIFTFESIVFPCARRVCNLTPLRRMCAGGAVVAVSYVLGGFLQLQINSTLPSVPKPQHSFVFRAGNSNVRFWTADGSYMLMPEQNEWPSKYTRAIADTGQEFNLTLESTSAYVVALYGNNSNVRLETFRYDDRRPSNGKERVYVSVDPQSPLVGQSMFLLDRHGRVVTEQKIRSGNFIDILPLTFGSNDHRLTYGPKCGGEDCPFQINLTYKMGGVYLLEVNDNLFYFLQLKNELKTLIAPNQVSIMWQLPQIIVISFGEVLVCVTVLEFAYSQAAPSMKSILQASWLMTSFLGNLIDMAVSGTKLIKEPAFEMFFYACMMFVVTIVFICLSTQYQYVNPDDFKVDKSKSDQSSKVTWLLDTASHNGTDFLTDAQELQEKANKLI